MKEMLSMVNGTPPSTNRACSHCKKQESVNPSLDQKFKRCSRCRNGLYCSRACQRADWKAGHKRACIFNAMTNNYYLDSLPSEEVAMDQLIDAYRLRVEDDLMYRGHFHGRYTAAADDDKTRDNDQDSLEDFQEFLNRAEAQIGRESLDDVKKASILPSWWSSEKRALCECRAMGRDTWSTLRYSVKKDDIREHYNDSLMPMKLRMLAETVYGCNVMEG